MENRKILRAEPGTVLTNGESYGTVIYLAEGDDGTGWLPITREEYEARLAAPQAEEADYQAALADMGVDV